jgi:hypothetical protein
VSVLGLDEDRVEQAARLYTAYARNVLRRFPPGMSPEVGEAAPFVGASSLVIAASLEALLRPARARQLFEEAARAYAALGNPFHVILAVCGGVDDLLARYVASVGTRLSVSDQVATDPTTLFCDLIAITAGMALENLKGEAVGVSWRVISASNQMSGARLGRLGLPSRLYGNVCESQRNAIQHEDRDLRQAVDRLGEYLRRADEVFAAAVEDVFHWERLRTRLMPVEAEVLALCLAIQSTAQNVAHRDLEELLRGQELSQRQLVPVVVAARMTDRPTDRGFAVHTS